MEEGMRKHVQRRKAFRQTAEDTLHTHNIEQRLTEHAQQVNLFLTLGVGHVDDALVALGSADMGKANTGVSGSSLNNRSASLDQSYFPHQLKQVDVSW